MPQDQRSQRTLFISLVSAGPGLAWFLAALPRMQQTNAWTIDFVAYRDASLRLAEGASPYSVRSLSGPFLPFGSDLFLYPPPTAAAVTE